MADIEKFTGYKAIDGSTHKTAKAAIAHTREYKIKAALGSLFVEGFVVDGAGVSETSGGRLAIYSDNIADFLYANREGILAAFNQEVSLRAPRKKRDLKAEIAKAATAVSIDEPEFIVVE